MAFIGLLVGGALSATILSLLIASVPMPRLRFASRMVYAPIIALGAASVLAVNISQGMSAEDAAFAYGVPTLLLSFSAFAYAFAKSDKTGWGGLMRLRVVALWVIVLTMVVLFVTAMQSTAQEYQYQLFFLWPSFTLPPVAYWLITGVAGWVWRGFSEKEEAGESARL